MQPLFDAVGRVRMQEEIPSGRFPMSAPHALGGRHAPARVRDRGRVQRQSTAPAAIPARARLPGRAASRPFVGRSDPSFLPLPEPQRGRTHQSRGLEAGILARRARRADRSVRLGGSSRSHISVAAHWRRVRAGARRHHRHLRHVDAGAGPERAHEHRPRPAGAARLARAVPARGRAVRRRHLGQRRLGICPSGPRRAHRRATRHHPRHRRPDHPRRLRIAVPDPHRARRRRPGARPRHARGRRPADGYVPPQSRPLPYRDRRIPDPRRRAKVPGGRAVPSGNPVGKTVPPRSAANALLPRFGHRGSVLRCRGDHHHVRRRPGAGGRGSAAETISRRTGHRGARRRRRIEQRELPASAVSHRLRNGGARGACLHRGRRPDAAVGVRLVRVRRRARRVSQHRARLPARDGHVVAAQRGTHGGRLVESLRRSAQLRARPRRVGARAGQQGAPSLLRRRALPAGRSRAKAAGLPRERSAGVHHVGRWAALPRRRELAARRIRAHPPAVRTGGDARRGAGADACRRRIAREETPVAPTFCASVDRGSRCSSTARRS